MFKKYLVFLLFLNLLVLLSSQILFYLLVGLELFIWGVCNLFIVFHKSFHVGMEGRQINENSQK